MYQRGRPHANLAGENTLTSNTKPLDLTTIINTVSEFACAVAVVFYVLVIDKVSLLVEHLPLLVADFLLTVHLYNPTHY